MAPIFTPLAPTTNGWTTTLTANTNHIAVLYGDMLGNDGPYTRKVTARNPNTNTKTSAGTKLVNTVTSYTSSAEATTTNNASVATTTVPSFDLTILKKGSVEGAYPGTTPGAPMSYTITVQNPSTVPACGIYFTDAVPTGFVYGNISPTTISLTDTAGNAKKFETAAGVPINTNTNLVQTVTGQDYRYQFGTTHTDICMPAGTQAQFTITGTIDANVTDGTQLSNVATVGEDSPGVEDVLINNTATSTVSVWRADVTTSKDGYSCGPDNICGNADDSQTNANIGETLRYKLEYNNIGNFNASNTILEELVPAGTCFKVGSISPIPGTTVETAATALVAGVIHRLVRLDFLATRMLQTLE